MNDVCPPARPDADLARLTWDLGICPDGPVVKGTSIPHSRVVALAIDHTSYSDIRQVHPELTDEDIDACMRFDEEFRDTDSIGPVPGGFPHPAADDRLDALDADLGSGLADTGMAPAALCRFATGAVRSNDRAKVRYDLLTPIGLRRVAETCHEGAAKYSDFNWEKGMPVHDLLNHAIPHIYAYLSGDRSEDHLAHAAWNLLAACHSEELWPDLNDGTLRRPGCLPPAAAKGGGR